MKIWCGEIINETVRRLGILLEWAAREPKGEVSPG